MKFDIFILRFLAVCFAVIGVAAFGIGIAIDAPPLAPVRIVFGVSIALAFGAAACARSLARRVK